jgi:predicted enzyme related to lactoylglutathione lyase
MSDDLHLNRIDQKLRNSEPRAAKEAASINRRNILRVGLSATALPAAALLNLGCTPDEANRTRNSNALPDNQSNVHNKKADEGSAMKIQYLEIVTTDVDGACELYSQMHGVTFGDADQNLGGARTAKLAGGGMLGIRGPLRPTEKPVVRPYVLVKDIKASIAAAAKAGAEIAMEPTEIPGYGQFAIVIHGGIESGLWQL